MRVFKPAAMVELKTGLEGTPPTMWKHAEVMLRDLSSDEMRPHPAFCDEKGRPMQMRELDIELISNLVEYNCGSHLECREYNKKTIFCSRNHRGKDELGIASRLGEDGEYFLTICDPEKCDMRINAVQNNSKTRRLHEKWSKLYPSEIALSGRNNKGQLEAVKCKHTLFFIFRLLTPEGEYAHATGEFCLFSSHAETNHRIYRKLCDFFDSTNGNLAGLRLKLVYDPIETKFGGPAKAAWNIFQPEGTDLGDLRKAAIERAVSQQTALVRVGDSVGLARVIEDNPDILSMALGEKRRQEQIRAEQGDPKEAGLLYFNPMVREICERLDFSNMWLSTLPMIAKGNMSRFVHWARQQAENYSFTPYGETVAIPDPRSIEDILQKYGYGEWQATPAALPETAGVAPTEEEGVPPVSSGNGVYQASEDDAEFTVVPDAPVDAQALIDAAKGIPEDATVNEQPVLTPTAAEPAPPPVEPKSPQSIAAKAKAKRAEMSQYPELATAAAEQTSIFGGDDT